MRRLRHMNAWLLPLLALPLFSGYVSSKDVDPKYTLDFPNEKDHHRQDGSDEWPVFLQAAWVRVGCYSDNIRSRTLRREIGSVSRAYASPFPESQIILQAKILSARWAKQFG